MAQELPTTEQVTAYLEQLEPAKLPLPIFMQAARLLTQASVEMVPLRTNDEGKTEVLLTQRAEDDPVWPGKWHVPGTILRASDTPQHPTDYSEAFDRLIGPDGELEGTVRPVAEPVYVGTERRVTARGPELSAIHYVEVAGEPTLGKFVPVEQLPEAAGEPGVIAHHADFIPRVVAAYEATNKNS